MVGGSYSVAWACSSCAGLTAGKCYTCERAQREADELRRRNVRVEYHTSMSDGPFGGTAVLYPVRIRWDLFPDEVELLRRSIARYLYAGLCLGPWPPATPLPRRPPSAPPRVARWIGFIAHARH